MIRWLRGSAFCFDEHILQKRRAYRLVEIITVHRLQAYLHNVIVAANMPLSKSGSAKEIDELRYWL